MSDDETTTILVIEDEEVVRESLVYFLEDRDFRVLSANGGQKGLELLDQERPDLVLTDLRMPAPDGLHVLRRARELSPETPVIVVSGTGSIADSVAALHLGAWDFILKPVAEMSVIAHAVDRALERARLLRENNAYQLRLEALVSERTAELERANAELSDVNARLRRIVETTGAIADEASLAPGGAGLLYEFAKHMFASGGCLYLVEDDGLRLVECLETGHATEWLPFPLPPDCVLAHVMDRGKPLLIPDVVLEPDVTPSGWGGYHDGSTIAFPLSDETGRITRIVALYNKLQPPFTEQDLDIGSILASYAQEALRSASATRALRKSEERYRLLAENVTDIIWAMDLTPKLTYVSPSVFELTGYTFEEMMDLPLRQVVAAESLHELGLLARRKLSLVGNATAEAFAPVAFELEQTCKDGSTVWTRTHAKLVHDEQGRATGVVGVTHDITDRKRAEEALVQAQYIAGIGDFSWDICTGEILWSPGMHKLLRHDPSAAFDYERFVKEVFHQEDRDEIVSWWQDSIAAGVELLTPREHRLLCADGEVIFVLTRGRIEHRDGAPVKLFGICQDISARKQAETEKAKLEEQLRQAQKMESIGQLAGGVAHDFNNLLTGINGYAEILLTSMATTDPLRGHVEEIWSAGQRAASLTNQLLAFSRKQVIAPKVIRPKDVLERSRKMLRRLIGENIDLQFVVADDTGQIMADPAQLDQILVNLAVNARDAMPHGGKLIILARDVFLDEAFCRIHVGLSPGPYVLFSVSDTGHGMDEDTMSKIFEPFFSTKTKERGTGLGLATVYGIVKQNNAHISVSSALNMGTTVDVYFPRAKGEAEDLPEAAPSGLATGTETILLVEDEEMVRKLAKEILDHLGYHVIVADSGLSACQMSESHSGQIQLLLTDVVMPNMNGRQLYESLRQSRPSLKALFMSGYTDDVVARHGVLDGTIDFIQKPFTMADLAQRVRQALNS